MRPAARILPVLTLCIFIAYAERAWAIWQPGGIAACAPSGSQQAPAVIPDGAGGVFVVWEDHRGIDRDIYAQRIDKLGNLQWGSLGVGIAVFGGDQRFPKIIADGAGGAIITWQDERSGQHAYAQRVSGLGIPQWTQNGVPVETSSFASWTPDLVPDGNGGAIITGQYLTNVDIVYAQRLDAAGTRQWGSDGVLVANGSQPAIAEDGAGGVVLTWTVLGGGTEAQRLDSGGNKLWNNGNSVTVAAFGNGASKVLGVGGQWIVTWSDNRLGNFNIYSQALDQQGVAQWLANGAPVSLAPGEQQNPAIAPDAGSGAIITWEDERTGTPDIYAQRIDALGAPQWSLNGVSVSSAADAQLSPQITADGVGGAVISWLDYRGGFGDNVYAQRLAASGGGLWTLNGVGVSNSTGAFGTVAIAPDGSNSAIVAWADQRLLPPNVYAQRIEFKYGYWGHPEPIVDTVLDVPHDQGGSVEVHWSASQLDLPAGSQIDHYSIWVSSQGLPHPWPWTEVGTVAATAQPAYEFYVHTWNDSTPSDPAIHQFKVIAHSLPSLDYSWESLVVDGYSVDNLPPAAPASLVAQRLATGDVALQWSGVTDADFDHYAVYRAAAPGVSSTPANFLATAPGSTLLDSGAPAGSLYYIVTAVDVHTNQSGSSNEAGVSGATAVGDTPPLTVLTVSPNRPNPFSGTADLEIGLPHASDMSLEVYDVAGRLVNRTEVRGAGGWQRMTLTDHDGEGRRLPSGVYFYRVRAGASTVTRKMVIAR